MKLKIKTMERKKLIMADDQNLEEICAQEFVNRPLIEYAISDVMNDLIDQKIIRNRKHPGEVRENLTLLFDGCYPYSESDSSPTDCSFGCVKIFSESGCMYNMTDCALLNGMMEKTDDIDYDCISTVDEKLTRIIRYVKCDPSYNPEPEEVQMALGAF